MAAPSGREDPHVALVPVEYARVERMLRSEPWSFQFFQAVRWLQRMYPERQPVGRFVNPSREVVRFGAHASMAFPASQIQHIDWSAGAPCMVVNFMGLTGPLGVLPLYYTELVLQRLRAKDPTVPAFFDLFNHRAISLFYKAWEKYRFNVSYERGERDRMSRYLLDFIGLGTHGLQKRQAVGDESLIFYSGLLALHPRSAASLTRILEDYFDVPVEVEQFVGAWYPLDQDNQCSLDLAGSCSEQLGVGAVVGDEIWDQQSGVRIRLGPLPLAQYIEFLPGGPAHEPLCALARFFAGSELDFEVQLVLQRQEAPPAELGKLGDDGPRLGWSTWMKTAPMSRDPGDTILRI